MLARVYLSMQDYDNALIYADACLQQYNTLIDYNPPISTTSTSPFLPFNDEVIFNITLNNYGIFFGTRAIIDSTLYKSYNTNDLRRTIFFRTVSGNPVWKGSYFGGSTKFSGLATDEVYLIRAECNARKGNTAPALADLNTLMQKRWKNTVTFPPVTAIDADDALRKILIERRKELIFRGLRWTDLRRLNKDTRFAVILTRTVTGQPNTLPNNDQRYVLPIPDDVIRISGIAQNPRE